jgi:sugar/nucleoside kinase (ribokinase family)
VTRGNKGVVISDGNYIYRAGIFSEEKLVDRTGAGDAFGSGFIAGLLHRKVNLKDLNKIDPKYILEAIKLASANATSVVEHIGAQKGILTHFDYKKQSRFKKLDIKLEKI